MALKLLFLYSDPFGERLINNLINLSTFCTVCADTCNKCRAVYDSRVKDIQGIFELPSNLPSFVEEPEKYFPADLPEVDVIITVALHQDLMAAISHVVEVTKAKAVIAPVENPNWAPLGLQQQVRESLEAMDVEVVFPKPFCSLKKTGLKTVDQFIDEYKIGYPVLTTEIEDGVIQNATVIRSSPCGCSWYVAQRIRLADLDELNEEISMAHHSYPCTASMVHDRELGDTILHKAGYIARETVRNSIKVSHKSNIAERSEELVDT
ncbi:MAG: DUF166 domain-containing protein [Candidatus Odinarchaeota archaeon]